MQNHIFTITVRNRKDADFARLSVDLHARLMAAFSGNLPKFSAGEQGKHTLQISVAQRHAEAVMERVEEWRALNREVDIEIKDERLDILAHRAKRRRTDLAECTATPGRIPDHDFVDEEPAE